MGFAGWADASPVRRALVARRCAAAHPSGQRPPPTQEYNTEAAFAAAVLLSFLALFTLLVKDRLESQAAQETSK